MSSWLYTKKRCMMNSRENDDSMKMKMTKNIYAYDDF